MFPYQLEKPITTLKRIFKELTIIQWQFECDYVDTDRLTHNYFPKVDIHRLVSCKLFSQIFTGQGVFSAYLHRFALEETPKCEHRLTDTCKHCLTACPLTQILHLVNITPNNQ